MKFVVVSPFYNCENFISKCVESLKEQEYKNFYAYFIDDMSTDNSLQELKNAISNDSRFNIIVNTEKKYALKNIYDCLNSIELDKEDVILQIDGDDGLANKNSLNLVYEKYKNNDCWATYGSYVGIRSKQRGGSCIRLPKQIILSNNIRRYRWVTSHLKTFKYGLFKKIMKEDFLDLNGNFFKTTHDLAIMFPILEMAGLKSYFIEDIIYLYNDLNDNNDHKKNTSQVLNNAKIIRKKTPYTPIVEL